MNDTSFLKSKNYQGIVIAIVIILSQGLLLLNEGVFWDDWCYFKEPELVLNHCKDLGIPLLGYFHYFIQYTDNPAFFYRLLLFLSLLISSLILYKTLHKLNFIERNYILFIVLYFALFPVNTSRISGACTQYSVCLAIFFLGVNFLINYQDKKIWPLRILSLVLFFISFATNSLLFFYILVMLFLTYKNWNAAISKTNNIKNVFLKYPDFILLPFLFWVIKCIYMVPISEFRDYNSISIRNVLYSVYIFPKSFFITVIQTIYITIATGINHLVFLLASSAFFWMVLTKNNKKESMRFNIIAIIAGGALIYIGLFPYAAVGKYSANIDWDDRHQLLVPLGGAIWLFYFIEFLFIKLKDSRRVCIHYLLLSFFFVYNVAVCLDAQRDWFKQLSIIENIKINETIRNNTSFLVNDLSENIHLNNRTYRFYEYAGLFKHSFNNEVRFAIREQDKKYIQSYKPYFGALYNMKHYRFTEPTHLITIDVSENISYYKVISTIYKYHFNEEDFKREVKSIVSIKVDKL